MVQLNFNYFIDKYDIYEEIHKEYHRGYLGDFEGGSKYAENMTEEFLDNLKFGYFSLLIVCSDN